MNNKQNGDVGGDQSEAGLIFIVHSKRNTIAEENRSEFLSTRSHHLFRQYSRVLILTGMQGESEAKTRIKTYDLLHKRATGQLRLSGASEGSNEANARMRRIIDEFS